MAKALFSAALPQESMLCSKSADIPTSQQESDSQWIPMYDGCQAFQVLQNRAARDVTKSNLATSSSAMLLQVGWLNVHQMIIFCSLVLLFKAKLERQPL